MAKFKGKETWDSLMLDDVKDQRIADELFNIAVHRGTKAAVILLQHVLKIEVNGVLEPKTISKLNNHRSPAHVLLQLHRLGNKI